MAENGSHEAVVFANVPKDEGITQKQLMVCLIHTKVKLVGLADH